jgi:hypothetical protein
MGLAGVFKKFFPEVGGNVQPLGERRKEMREELLAIYQ